MNRLIRITLVALLGIGLLACAPAPTPTAPPPTAIPAEPSTATPEPTATATATLTPEPTATLVPSPTPFPTAAESAPEKTFTDVGDVAELSGTHGLAGRAIVAGLQTLIIRGFTYDGKGPAADIRLVKGDGYDEPAAILLVLEPRAYENEMLVVTIPSNVDRSVADRIVIYAPETSEVYAESQFE
jgi:hypothetical protein